MGAASLHHPHPLAEMLNLLSASLSLVAVVCMQAVSVIHCGLPPFTHSLIQGRARIREPLQHHTVLRIIYDNNRTISETL